MLRGCSKSTASSLREPAREVADEVHGARPVAEARDAGGVAGEGGEEDEGERSRDEAPAGIAPGEAHEGEGRAGHQEGQHHRHEAPQREEVVVPDADLVEVEAPEGGEQQQGEEVLARAREDEQAEAGHTQPEPQRGDEPRRADGRPRRRGRRGDRSPGSAAPRDPPTRARDRFRRLPPTPRACGRRK